MKKLLFTFLAVMVSVTMNAEKVSRQKALQKAQQFMPGKHFTAARSRSLTRGDDPQTEEESLYILNAVNGGFVIVSGDDRTEPILGYSDKGRIDINNMPDNLRVWLANYEAQIKSLPEDYRPTQAYRDRTRGAKTAIAPLITTTWGQGGVYNAMCPKDNGVNSKTGCVATALAQVMNYHQWPKQSPAIPGYVTETKKIVVDDLPTTTFKWNLMKDSYNLEETGASADAVAELMRYCGQCMLMDYEKDGSGAGVFIDRLAEFFGYSRSAHHISRTQYTYSEWENIIYQELFENRPVLLSAFNQHLAHEFICDGYDGNGLFHLNWGWYGNDDGFYLLSVRSDGNFNIPPGEKDLPEYCYEGDAVIGIKPSNDEATYDDGTYGYLYDKKTKEATITSYNSTEKKDVVIPELVTINEVNYSVTTIGTGAFDYSNITSLVIPSSVKHIRNRAFHWNIYLQELNIPEGVETIGEEAFENCVELKTIKLPSTIIRIGGNAFFNHKGSLKTVISKIENPCILSQNVFCTKDIWEGNSYANSVERVTPMPATLYVPIGTKQRYESAGWTTQFLKTEEGEPFNYSYNGMNFLCSPESKTAIVVKGDYSALEEVNIPVEIPIGDAQYHIKWIDDGAFLNCYNLTTVVLHSGLLSIGNNAFEGCNKLSSATIPDGVESIGNEAFYRCDLKELVLPSSLKTIGGDIICFCDNITSIISYIRTPQTVSSYNDSFLMTRKYIEGAWVDLPTPATLYVPKGTLKAYQRTLGWNVPENIVEMENGELFGDLTHDGQVNGSDLEKLVGVITEGGNDNEADVNEDGIVNGTDAVTLVNLSSNDNAGSTGEVTTLTGKANAALSIIDFDIKAGETKQMLVCVNNPDMDVTMVEFYLRLPSGLSVAQENGSPSVGIVGRTTGQNHTIKTKTTGDVTHIFLYSRTNATLYGKYGALTGITLKADNTFKGGTIQLENLLLADPYETECKPETLTYSITEDDNLNDDDIFTITIPEGIKMTFQVISAADKTCQVGTGENNTASFDRSYSGELTIPAIAKGYSVVKIAPFACSYSKVTKVIVSEGIESIEDRAFAYNKEMASISLPEGLTSIVSSIVWGCEQLKSFHLPSTVTIFENCNFGWCDALEEITVAEGNPVFDSRDNCNAIIRTATKTLVAGCKATVIPSSVKKLEHSFEYLPSLSEIVIPEGVRAIGRQTFCNTSLTKITIPSTVNTIDSWAFDNCNNLTEVTVMQRTPYGIISDAFPEAAYKGVLYVPVGSKSLYENTDGWNKFENIVEKDLQIRVEEFTQGGITYEYYMDKGLAKVIKGDAKELEDRDVTIPSTITVNGVKYSVKEIENKAFYGIYMKSLSIESGIEDIGSEAFQECYKLTNVVIPEGVKTIGEQAFRLARGLKSIDLPSSLTSIGGEAFSYCFPISVIARMSVPCNIHESAFVSHLWINDQTVTSFSSANLYVPSGKKETYKNALVWKNFSAIVVLGDVDGNGYVQQKDVDAIANYLLGKTLDGFDEKGADANLDGKIDAADIVKMINIIKSN